MALTIPDLMLARLDPLANWVRANSLWPMPFATACCGIELMATGASKHDIARFGAEVMRFSPRQCDLMIVAGRVAMKMLPVLQRIWMQMPEPKWCISGWGRMHRREACSRHLCRRAGDRSLHSRGYVSCARMSAAAGVKLIQSIIDLSRPRSSGPARCKGPNSTPAPSTKARHRMWRFPRMLSWRPVVSRVQRESA